jgi:hypothetical protein
VAAKKVQLTEDNPKTLSFQSEIIAVIYCIFKGYADLKSMENNHQRALVPWLQEKTTIFCLKRESEIKFK